MTKRYPKFIILAAAIALAISGLLYFTHYLIFRDVHHIFIYMLGDLAFLPLEVFLVVIVIERILSRREKQAVLQKLNMIVGAFFSEVGTRLLHDLLDAFCNRREISRQFAVNQNWKPADFRKAIAFAYAIEETPDCLRIDLEALRTFLSQGRPFLVGLLANPHILEYENFTDLLWAVFHLAEELEARRSVKGLPQSDLEHLAGDIKRLYGHLAAQWLAYTQHLKVDYPYLFSLVLRTHPFQEQPSPTVS